MISDPGRSLLLETLPNSVCVMAGAEHCTLLLADSELGWLCMVASTSAPRGLQHPMVPSLAARALTSRASTRMKLGDLGADDFAAGVDGSRVKSLVYVPLRTAGNRVVGVLELVNRLGGDGFTDEEITRLEAFGPYGAMAIEGIQILLEAREVKLENTATKQELVEQFRRMELLRRIENAINETQDFETTLSRVLALCTEALGADAGSILLDDGTGTDMGFKYVFGETSERVRRLTVAKNEGIAGWVVKFRKPTYSNAPAEDPRHSARIAEMVGYRVSNLAAVPLFSAGRAVGALEVLNRPGGFSDTDLTFLQFLGSQIVSALDKKLLLDEARSAQRLAAVGNMAARIIHDLKHPMSVIKLIVTDMKLHEVSPETQKSYLEMLVNAVDQLAEMTQDVLDFSRGDLRCEFTEVDLALLLGEVLEHLGRDCSRRGIQLVSEIQEGLRVRADVPRLRRVFMNLGSNALDAMEAGGRLRFRAVNDGAAALIDVIDSGPGIPVEIRSQIFEPFVTFAKEHGTGLGLAICKSIVDAHGGTIGLTNVPEGGACFTVRIPRNGPGR